MSRPDGDPEGLSAMIYENGRLVLPKELREKLGIDGRKARLYFRETEDGILLHTRVERMREAQRMVLAALADKTQPLTDTLKDIRRDDMAVDADRPEDG